MQMSSTSSFVDRVIGAIRLDPATYEAVEHDTDATWQAAVVVVVAAIFSGVGSTGGRTRDLLGGVVASLVFWALFALFAYLVGAYLLRGPQTSATFGEVLRALGFSYAPSLFAILGLIPGIGFLIVFIAGIWSLIASVIALRQAFEVSTGRAVAIAVVAFLAMVVLLVIIATVFGISIVAIDSLTSRPA
jgi:Yip1 domain